MAEQPDNIALSEACAFILGVCEPIRPVEIPIESALGRVLAMDVSSPNQVPPFDNSAMDGYALIATDCAEETTPLIVGEAIMAGHIASSLVAPGHAMPIMTGAPVPLGATAVCPIERTVRKGSKVLISGPVHSGENVRRAGEDIEVGDTVARAGMVIGPVQMGILASIGRASVNVYNYPRVGVLSTGDELVGSGDATIQDSNRSTLLSALTAEGVLSEDLGVVGDDVDALAKRLNEAIERCDVVITTGGVSVGERDVVRDVLEILPTDFARRMMVAIKPAKPLAFAILRSGDHRSVPLFGLPGNPVSAFISFQLFARPTIRRLGGHRELWPPIVECIAEEDLLRKPDDKIHFKGAYVQMEDCSGRFTVRQRQAPHILTSLNEANGLIVLPNGDGVHKGEVVRVMVLDAASTLRSPKLEADVFETPSCSQGKAGSISVPGICAPRI